MIYPSPSRKLLHVARNVRWAQLSSGSVVGIETKMVITLRTLAGAAYIDMIWYVVPINHVSTYVMDMVDNFNRCWILFGCRQHKMKWT